MSKTEYIQTLRHTIHELRGLVGNWQPKYDLERSIGTLVDQMEGVVEAIAASSEPFVLTETGQAVWELSRAVDIAAEQVDPEVARHASVHTTFLRNFYLVRGAIVDSQNRITFPGTQ